MVTMTLRRVLYAAAGLALLLPAVGFGWAGGWSAGLMVLCLGLLWVVALRPAWRGAAPVALAVTALLCAAGALAGALTGAMLGGLVAALCAYDLAALDRRAAGLDEAERTALEVPHLRRLGMTAAIGMALGGIALLVRAQPGFAGLAALALLAIGVLTRAMRRATASGR
jgi:hypothetical protein